MEFDTITKDTKIQTLEFTLMTEKPITELEVPSGEGKTLGDCIREQQEKNITNKYISNNYIGKTNSQREGEPSSEQMRLVWHKSEEGEERRSKFRKQ